MNDKQNSFVKYGYRHHCGGLRESLQTKNYITSENFEKMLRTGNYRLYGYDSRCNQVLWLHTSTETWLFIEFVNP